MLNNAVRLCEAQFGGLFLREGDSVRQHAMHAPSSAHSALRQRPVTFNLLENSSLPIARMLKTKASIHVADLRFDQSYIERNPRIVPIVESAGARTVLAVPMLKDDEVIGAITVYRQDVR